MPASAAAVSRGSPPHVRIDAGTKFQEMEGFGGCFNERGWVALGHVPAGERRRVMESLFGADGCAFMRARLPIGASDFGLDGYSLDDTPGDWSMKDFSIARDEKLLIPFVRAAMEIQPELRCWGSPWSPPAWMKTNSHYSGGSLRWEPEILGSYAVYLARWIEAYRAAGIGIYGLSPQNEPNITNVYPTCLWTGEQLREFIAEHLGPTLRERKIDVELWLGLNGDPLNGGENPNNRLRTVMDDPRASSFVTGIAFQYDSRNQTRLARELYPQKKLMQSETVCNGGANSWADALTLYGLMRRHLESGAGSYFLWNMVLDETGMSTWNWRQNAPVTVNREAGTVTFNGEYHVMRHFSRFVKPGARRVLSTAVWDEAIAFANPGGSIVAVIANPSKAPREMRLAVSGNEPVGLRATLPGESIHTFVLQP